MESLSHWCHSVFLILVIVTFVNLSDGKTVDEDLTLTLKEKRILDQFKQIVAYRMPVDYMKQEVFLMRWLRAKNFNIQEAEKMLMDHVNWWIENRMEGIQEEDWAEMKKEYPYWLEGRDKESKPLLYLNIAYWDLRKAVVSGKQQRFLRYIDGTLDEACGLVRELGEKYKNVSQGVLIMNADGFSLQQHGCVQCISIILRILVAYETHYPGCADKIIVVNIPRAAEFIVQAARAAINKETNNALLLHGTNKERWQMALSKYFDPTEIPPELGGVKSYKGMEDFDY